MQRQFLKENISENIIDEKKTKFSFDEENLKKLFAYNSAEICTSFPQSENEIDDIQNLVLMIFLLTYKI